MYKHFKSKTMSLRHAFTGDFGGCHRDNPGRQQRRQSRYLSQAIFRPPETSSFPKLNPRRYFLAVCTQPEATHSGSMKAFDSIKLNKRLGKPTLGPRVCWRSRRGADDSVAKTFFYTKPHNLVYKYWNIFISIKHFYHSLIYFSVMTQGKYPNNRFSRLYDAA